MVGHVGDQRDGPGPLDRDAQGSLVFGAYTCPSTRFDLGAFRNEPANFVDLFIIDMFNVLYTEGAHAAPGGEPASGAPTWPSSSASARSSTTTASTLIALWRST